MGWNLVAKTDSWLVEGVYQDFEGGDSDWQPDQSVEPLAYHKKSIETWKIIRNYCILGKLRDVSGATRVMHLI